MNLIEKVESLDLNVSVPRSSKETMAGIAPLPRMVDKARSYKNGTLGEYIYPCPLDQHILKFLQTDPESFTELAETTQDDQIAHWAEEASRPRSPEERETLNRIILDRKPTAGQMPSFVYQRDLFEPGRTDVVTYVELTDLEEGHI